MKVKLLSLKKISPKLDKIEKNNLKFGKLKAELYQLKDN